MWVRCGLGVVGCVLGGPCWDWCGWCESLDRFCTYYLSFVYLYKSIARIHPTYVRIHIRMCAIYAYVYSVCMDIHMYISEET